MAIRTRLGLTQSEAARLYGFTGERGSTYAHIEQGRRYPVTVDEKIRICGALNLVYRCKTISAKDFVAQLKPA